MFHRHWGDLSAGVSEAVAAAASIEHEPNMTEIEQDFKGVECEDYSEPKNWET